MENVLELIGFRPYVLCETIVTMILSQVFVLALEKRTNCHKIWKITIVNIVIKHKKE